MITHFLVCVEAGRAGIANSDYANLKPIDLCVSLCIHIFATLCGNNVFLNNNVKLCVRRNSMAHLPVTERVHGMLVIPKC